MMPSSYFPPDQNAQSSNILSLSLSRHVCPRVRGGHTLCVALPLTLSACCKSKPELRVCERPPG
eukprot:3934525-Rhodomonas_salina.2